MGSSIQFDNALTTANMYIHIPAAWAESWKQPRQVSVYTQTRTGIAYIKYTFSRSGTNQTYRLSISLHYYGAL